VEGFPSHAVSQKNASAAPGIKTGELSRASAHDCQIGVWMSHLRIRWHRVFGVYFTLAGVCLAGSCFQWPLWRAALVSGLGMVILFVPLVMIIYFLRGLLRLS
jgi:hypothetical protein